MSHLSDRVSRVSKPDIALPVRYSPIVPLEHLPIEVNGHDSNRHQWSHVVRTLKEHRIIALAAFVIVLGGVVIGTALTPRIYESEARVEVESADTPTLISRPDASIPQTDPTYLQTQISLFEGSDLALAVVRKLGLAYNPEFVPGNSVRISKQPADLPDGNIHATAVTEQEKRAVSRLASHLSVTLVKNSRLVSVAFRSRDPNLAALVANTMVDTFIERSHERKYETAVRETEWLTRQLDDLRGNIQKATQALASFQKDNAILDVNTDQSPTTAKLTELNRQLVQAKRERIQWEAALKTAQNMRPDAVPQVRDSEVNQQLVERLADTRAELSQMLAIYGHNNSAVRKLEAQAEELDHSIAAERERALAQLNASYTSALAQEEMTERALQQATASAGVMSRTMLQYDFLKKEVQTSEDLYNSLYGRLKEATLSAEIKSGSLIKTATAWPDETPVRPRWTLNLVLGFLGALIISLAIPFIIEVFETRVRTPEEIADLTGLNTLALVPRMGKRQLLAKGDNPAGPLSEAIGNLAVGVRVAAENPRPKTILITSPRSGEGKTSVTLNLAFSLAKSHRVCLMEVDLRAPKVGRILGLSGGGDLAEVLRGAALLKTALRQVPEHPNLSVVATSKACPDAGELIIGDSMRRVTRELAAMFDYVLLDALPLIPFVDARYLARLCDGVVLVVSADSTTREAVLAGARLVRNEGTPLLGVVLNKVRWKSPLYQDYRYEKVKAE